KAMRLKLNRCWALSSSPAPQALVRYTCVQDLSEASLGCLLYRGRHSTPSIASTMAQRNLNVGRVILSASRASKQRPDIAPCMFCAVLRRQPLRSVEFGADPFGVPTIRG